MINKYQPTDTLKRVRFCSKQSMMSALAMLAIPLGGFSSLKAQTVTVTPQEHTEGMRNPLMGIRDNATTPAKLAVLPFATAVRKYIYFNELDNNVNDGVDKIKQFTDTNFKDYEKQNVKVIVRVILQFTGSQYYWPADLAASECNYTSAVLRQRVLKTVANMGTAWDNDPRIAWVEVGLIGQWGEQESPQDVKTANVQPDNKSWAQILGPAFKAAFVNKKVQVRGPSKWLDTAGFNPGTYWDTYGSESSMLNSTYDFNSECVLFTRPPYERHKTVPQGGEIAYSVGVNQAQMGSSPYQTYTNPAYRLYLMNIARKIHTTSLGMEFSDAVGNNAVGSAEWNKVYAGAQEVQKVLGYRFLIPEFSCTQQVGADRLLSVTAKIKNDGTAPFYDKWPLSVVLINKTTKAIEWTSPALNANVNTWYPGANWDWTPVLNNPGTGTLKFLTPAPINTVQDTVTIPSNIANGTYYVGLSVIDPTTGKPGLFFSVKNFFKASNTQPLAEIGIGVAPSNPTLTNVTFDNYDWLNDTRSYSLIAAPSATTYTLSETSLNGSVTFSPAGPTYAAGTTVTVTSVPTAGYFFSSWSGDLSGATNPTTIVMNGNKSIVANVTNVATVNYTLTETSLNGSVTFSPAGPTYASGTTVTVTSVPTAGYYFSNWSGDLSGTTNPTTIVMNGNKSIVANVTNVAPVNYTLTETSPNGSVTFSPAGPSYPSGTTVTVTSVPAAGYVFTGWSGDLSGTTNPTTIVMNSNKSIVANTTTAALPSPWSTADVGSVAAIGSATLSGGTWTIVGSGADIEGTADEFRYVYQASSGDCEIVARVASLQNTNGWAKTGVMIRETTAANAQSVILCVTPANGVSFQQRAATGGTTVINQTVAGTAPKWLKLKRTGSTFTASSSDNGTTWTQVGTNVSNNMSANATIGLALTSHADGTLCTSTIDSVSATP